MSKLSPKYQKDYRNVTFKNPKNIKEDKQKIRIKLKTILIIIGIFILAIVYFLYFSPYFKINNIEITGISKISQEKFKQIVANYEDDKTALFFSHKNILIFSEKGLKKKIGESYLLDNIVITKEYPKTIKIEVKEKNPNLIWLTQSQCYLIDNQGLIIESCPETELDFIKIKDNLNNTVKIGESIPATDWLDKIVMIKNSLHQYLTLELFYFDEDYKSLKVSTDKSYDLYFSSEMNIDEQVDRLLILLQMPPQEAQIDNVNYIDLRFGDKIYIK